MKSTVAPSPLVIIGFCILGITIASLVIWAKAHPQQEESTPQPTPTMSPQIFDRSHIVPNETEAENLPEMTPLPFGPPPEKG
jgi:hypothetical protein